MIALGSDHAGYQLKEKIKAYLLERGYRFTDFGTFDEASVDYPDYAFYVGRSVASGECERGILICGTGIGIGIAANKIPGIRAALCHDLFSAQACREHNDANILTLGAGLIGTALAKTIVKTWLETAFAGGRHAPRVEKIMALEKQSFKSGS